MLKESIKLALGNIWRTKLRHFLTMCGIMIGTGAIVSMVSYAVGMRNEISRTIASSGLLTTIYVMPNSGALASFGEGRDTSDPDDFGGNRDTASATHGAIITDETVRRITSIKGVTGAFPLVAFPALVGHGSKQVFAIASGLPSSIGEVARRRLEKGDVFSSENDSTVLVSIGFAKRLGLNPDSIDAKTLKSGIPLTITIVTVGRGFGSPGAAMSPLASLGMLMSFERKSFRFYLKGLLKETVMGPIGRADCYLPLRIAEEIAGMTIQDPGAVLRNPSLERGGYFGAEVYVSRLTDIENVSKQIRAMNLTTFSVADQFKEMRTAFVFVSAFLGAIGGVALFVGCLGIVNIMLISVLERTREIGIMKSVGARRKDILFLFVTEAALIGLVGGILGILLGWVVAEVTNHVMFAFVIKEEVPFKRLYEIPFWLSAGAVGLAVAVSIIAGLYPARRAASLEPTAALRYE